MTTQMNVRIDETVKQQAEELLQGLGLSMSTAINLFARAVIREQGLPLTNYFPICRTYAISKNLKI